MKFGGFIITYQRPQILLNTLEGIFAQTVQPQHLWIIDNSEDWETEKVLREKNDSRLTYVRIGKNSGPAGAAAIGLKLVADAGYQWILWGDDDDPPPFENSFEKIFNLLKEDVGCLQIGQLGLVGQRFDLKRGKVIRISDSELQSKPWIKVDTIAGGQMKIISSDVLKKGILPDPDLFYGYEELSFDLNMKKAGFTSVVATAEFLEVRKKYGRIGFDRPVYSLKAPKNLWREYYSTRNLLFILKDNGHHLGYLYFLLKSITKGLYGFRYGWRFGTSNLRFVYSGIWHSFIGKKGKLEIFQKD